MRFTPLFAFMPVLSACAVAAPPNAASSSNPTAQIAATRAAYGAPHAINADYEGTLEDEGHFQIPYEVRTYPTSWHLESDGLARIHVIETVWEGPHSGDVSHSSTWLAPNLVVQKEDDGALAKRVIGDTADRLREETTWLFPRAVLDDAVRAHTEGSLRMADGRLAGASHAFGHPRLGDIVDDVEYGPSVSREGLSLPESITMVRHDRDDTWRLTLHLARVHPERPAESDLAPPSVIAPPDPPQDAPLTMEPLGEHVWAIPIAEADTRSFVVEFADYTVVLEAPLTSQIGERIADFVASRFPDKPIRYAFFGHYHPHYTGGLRGLMAAGATIVAPPKGAQLAESLATRPFTLAPDRLETSDVAPQVLPFEGRFVLEDSMTRLEAIDIGAASQHTAEYVLFYLPKAQLLIQGDLGWFADSEGRIRAAGRAKGVIDAIDAKNLRVSRVAQSWPLAGTPVSLPLTTLRALFLARRP